MRAEVTVGLRRESEIVSAPTRSELEVKGQPRSR